MLIKSLHIRGMLSFQDMFIDMRPLNVLIGPNASGKSNLIEIVALLQSLPGDLAGFIRQSGGISEWLWKGEEKRNELARSGRIEAILSSYVPTSIVPTSMSLRYLIDITDMFQRLDVLSERLEDEYPVKECDRPFEYFQVRAGAGSIVSDIIRTTESSTRQIKEGDLSTGQSILHEIRDPTTNVEITFLGRRLSETRIYREWNIGRKSAVRKPQPADAPNDFLNESFSNLALVINQLQRGPAIREIEENLREFYELYEQIGVSVEADGAQLWLREKGLQDAIPATRLSDGTLRYLALLTILCHPTPPPLICIEEPELGLHPDMIPQIGKLLLSASERTQLIVTTHSKALIDRLWEDPESVIVCERDFDAGSEFKRLSADKLEKWLERYELGELWEKGVLGGNRW